MVPEYNGGTVAEGVMVGLCVTVDEGDGALKFTGTVCNARWTTPRGSRQGFKTLHRGNQ
jgi:hypothetical protein